MAEVTAADVTDLFIDLSITESLASEILNTQPTASSFHPAVRQPLSSLISKPAGDQRMRQSNIRVSQLLRRVVDDHLPGCYKVVLYKTDDLNLRADFWDVLLFDLTSGWDGEAIVVWELEMFLNSPPSPDIYIFQHTQSRHTGSFCILFIVLADLQSVGMAFNKVQRGAWSQGAKKYMLVYTGTTVTEEELAVHSVLGKSYNLVVISPTPLEEEEKRNLNGSNTQLLEPVQEFWFLQTCPYCDAGNPRVNVIAKWRSDRGFIFSAPFYPDLFQDFNGHEFRAVTLVYEPFSCYDQVGEDFIPSGNCVDNMMIHEIAQSLNFTYIFTEPSDGQWGHTLDNGSYTGVIGTVERLEADFSLNIAITQDREEKVDCTIGYHIEPITFATSKPRPLNQAFALIRPFRGNVWAAFGITMLVAGPLYYLICTYASRPNQPRPPSLVVSCLMVYATCFNQSVKWLPISSSRLFAVTYVLTMYVTVTMYVAMLTASLTLPTLSPTLNELEELVKSDFSWGIQDLGAADYQLLKSSKVPLYQKVFQGLKQCPSLNECITRARDSKYAFITWRTYLEDRIAVKFTSSTGERQLHVAFGDIFPVELGWAMNPGCPYRHMFNAKIRQLLESGFISKWLDQVIHDPKRREIDEEDLMTSSPLIQALGLHHLQGLFFILLTGCSISFLVFLCELTLCKKKPLAGNNVGIIKKINMY